MNQINIETEEFVKNLKVTFFDIASQNQTIMDEIESFLSKEHDPQKVEDLQNLWANYHETVKVFLNSVEVISDALYKLEACNQSFNEIVEEKETMMDEEQLQASDEAISEIVPEEDEEIEEENTEEKDEIPQEEVKEEVEETPEVKEETPQEEVREEVEETPEVKEETPQEEVKEEVEETPEVKEEVEETTEIKEEEPKEPVEEAGDLEIVEEVNAADNPIPESISELSNVQEEAADVSKETIPLISSDTEDVSAEDEINDEVVEENEAESSPLILPVIEEENKQDEEMDDSLTNSSPVIADLPSLSTVSEDDEKLVFHKGMLVNDKAILVNTTQAAKLRGSLSQQKLLFNNESSHDEVVSENQLEEMMNQLATLYEQGKTKEAEQMSEKISVLNKKLTSAK